MSQSKDSQKLPVAHGVNHLGLTTVMSGCTFSYFFMMIIICGFHCHLMVQTQFVCNTVNSMLSSPGAIPSLGQHKASQYRQQQPQQHFAGAPLPLLGKSPPAPLCVPGTMRHDLRHNLGCQQTQAEMGQGPFTWESHSEGFESDFACGLGMFLPADCPGRQALVHECPPGSTWVST